MIKRIEGSRRAVLFVVVFCPWSAGLSSVVAGVAFPAVAASKAGWLPLAAAGQNQPETAPVAIFTITPAQPVLGQAFTVDGSLSFDRPSAGPITAYEWDWGDGTAGAAGVTAQHTYSAAGSYSLTLTVADAANPPNRSSTSTLVVILGSTTPPPSSGANRPPVAELKVSPANGFVGGVFTFDASGSSDPDGDPLVYRFTYGDGQQRAFGPTAKATHSYSAPGSYTVRLTVKDDQNASTDLSSSVRVVTESDNEPPVAIIATGPRSGAAPLTLTFDGRLSYDPEGGPLQHIWEVSLDGVITSNLIGSVVTVLFDEVGTYVVSLQVIDDRAAEATSVPAQVVVTEPGEVPEPPPPQPEPEPEDPPSSADQRPPAVCGVGMMMAFLGSLLGLTVIRFGRGRKSG